MGPEFPAVSVTRTRSVLEWVRIAENDQVVEPVLDVAVDQVTPLLVLRQTPPSLPSQMVPVGPQAMAWWSGWTRSSTRCPISCEASWAPNRRSAAGLT